jgi:hypothetical protein
MQQIGRDDAGVNPAKASLHFFLFLVVLFLDVSAREDLF